eukprot:7592514-Lingulodinium_polyedra.AAC.1
MELDVEGEAMQGDLCFRVIVHTPSRWHTVYAPFMPRLTKRDICIAIHPTTPATGGGEFVQVQPEGALGRMDTA